MKISKTFFGTIIVTSCLTACSHPNNTQTNMDITPEACAMLKVLKTLPQNKTFTLDLHPRITDRIERINL